MGSRAAAGALGWQPPEAAGSARGSKDGPGPALPAPLDGARASRTERAPRWARRARPCRPRSPLGPAGGSPELEGPRRWQPQSLRGPAGGSPTAPRAPPAPRPGRSRGCALRSPAKAGQSPRWRAGNVSVGTAGGRMRC